MTQIRQKLEPDPPNPRYFVTEPGIGFRFDLPEGGGRRWLRSSGVAVLYLIDGDDEPPTPTTCLEDWVRIPRDERDLRARVAALELRTLVHVAPPPGGR